MYKTANALDVLPKRLHDQAKQAIHAIYNAGTRADAVDRTGDFAERFQSHPKATAKITSELDTLLAFYDFPHEHWKHLRSTNAIESTFATVRLRTKVTKGPATAGRPWPWPTSSSTPPRPDGGASTATTS